MVRITKVLKVKGTHPPMLRKIPKLFLCFSKSSPYRTVLLIIFSFFSFQWSALILLLQYKVAVKLFVSSTLSPITNAMQCSPSSTAIYISGLMIWGSAQPMWFSLSSTTTRSLKMNWILYSQICILSVCHVVLYMIIGAIPSPPMVWELVSPSRGATFELPYLTRPSRASQTLWPGRTGSALAWLKMLINGEIEEEKPNFSPLLFQQLVVHRDFYLTYSFMHPAFFFKLMFTQISVNFTLKC